MNNTENENGTPTNEASEVCRLPTETDQVQKDAEMPKPLHSVESIESQKRKLDDAWKQCERAMIAGVTAEKAAATYGLSLLAVRKRAWRQGWPTPTRVRVASEAMNKSLPAVELAALDAKTTGENNRLEILRLVQEAIASAGNLQIEGMKDLKTALEVSDQASGLTTDKPAVNLLFGNVSAPSLDSASSDIPWCYEVNEVSAPYPDENGELD